MESNSPARACAIPKTMAKTDMITFRTNRMSAILLCEGENRNKALLFESRWRRSRMNRKRKGVSRAGRRELSAHEPDDGQKIAEQILATRETRECGTASACTRSALGALRFR